MFIRQRGRIRRLSGLIMALLLLATLLPASAFAQESVPSLTLLFTTDIHSNDVPHLTMTDGRGARCGGFARLKTEVDRQYVEGQTLLLDSGDFSMGTLYQNYCQSDALELTLMDAIGYDAVALGNHDFELGEDGLREELDTFRSRGGKLALLASNLTDGSGKVTSEQANNPLAAQGVQNYQVFERGGLRVGVFALMGQDAISYTPVTTFSFADPVASAKAMVRQLREAEGVDLVVALSHAGIMPDGSFHEDADIAKAVDGIDVILSGHEHVALPELVQVNQTMIACAGTALNALGKLALTRDAQGWHGSYELLPLDDTVAEDSAIAAVLADYTARIQTDYLTPLGVEEDVMAEFAVSPFDFADGDHMCLTFQNYPFGALIADAYFDGLEKAGIRDAVAAIIPVGFVRNGLYAGTLQMMDIYNALGYGISPLDGSSGAPICTFWLNGRELYDVCETSVSLSGMMNTVQMLIGGMRFTYGDGRLPLDRVYQVELLNRETGEYEAVPRDETGLYRVAVSWTAMQNLSLLSSKSFGLLSVTPKDANGVPYAAEARSDTVVLQRSGVELKEWYALYDFIRSMPTDGAGLHVIDAKYGETPAYMTEGKGGIGQFFTNPSKAFYVLLGIVVGLLAILALLTTLIVKLARRGKRRRARASATTLALVLAVSLLSGAQIPARAEADPLPSWRDGTAKARIVDFVTEAVTPGQAGFIPESDRIAVSDMDGTLICETGGESGKEYAEIELIRSLILRERAGDSAADIAAGEALARYDEAFSAGTASGEFIAPQLDDTDLTTYYYALVGCGLAGYAPEEAQAALARQLDQPYAAGRSFREVFYLPMLELYRYLCDNGFTFYIVSGSNQQIVSAMSRDALTYQNEPFPFARCIGAELVMELAPEGDRVLLTAATSSLNVNADKCVRIATRIGKRPVIALGNSTGDAEMLTYTLASGAYPTLSVLVNHDDAEREASYHAEELRMLCQAEGYLCVSMKDDFATIYGE